MDKFQDLAKEFVRFRDLNHCACFMHTPDGHEAYTYNIRIQISDLVDEWRRFNLRFRSFVRAQLEADPNKVPMWARAYAEHLDTNDIADWHDACQEIDRYWSTYEQGEHARSLGVPRDAAIHDKLDDGTDTLGPWLRGWDWQDCQRGNPKVFNRVPVPRKRVETWH